MPAHPLADFQFLFFLPPSPAKTFFPTPDLSSMPFFPTVSSWANGGAESQEKPHKLLSLEESLFLSPLVLSRARENFQRERGENRWKENRVGWNSRDFFSEARNYEIVS